MPPAKHTAGDVLRRHEAGIRKLYQTQNIEIVKRIMEREQDFPELAVSTWVEKFRELGIRKNVSSDEWRIIYLHCLPLLEDPRRAKGDLKLKRTKQDIEIVVRGRKYSWNQAWKNMKSAGAIGQQPRPDECLRPLPPGIEIQTLSSIPSPVPSISVLVAQPMAGAICTPPHGSVSRGVMLTSRQKNNFTSENEISRTPVSFNRLGHRPIGWVQDPAERVWQYCASLMPISTVITQTIDLQQLAPLAGGVAQRSQQRHIKVFPQNRVRGDLGNRELGASSTIDLECDLRDQFLSHLLWPATSDLATSASHKNYAMIFLVIYILSNKLVHLDLPSHFPLPHHSLLSKLDLVFAAVPVEYLESLIRRRLASIRAAYETLLILAGRLNQKMAFQLLLKIRFRHDWIAIPFWSHQLLYFAVSMGLDNALRILLDKSCRPDQGIPVDWGGQGTFPTAICEALRKGDIRSMKLLLDCCDVNEGIHSDGWDDELSNFDCFLLKFHDDEEKLQYGLNAFIRAGADINKPVIAPFAHQPLPSDYWDRWCVRKSPECKGETCLSVLDYLFYFHRSVFDAISSKSNLTQPGFLSRACILLSLEGSIQNLQQCLDSLAQRTDQQRLTEFLRLLIAEQFLLSDLGRRKRATDLETVRALASCSVSIAELLSCFPNLLYYFICLIEDYPRESNMNAVQYLLENGADVDGYALSWLAQVPEGPLLNLALNQVASSSEWHIAVAEVASRNDFQAVDRLLHAGVDLGIDTIDYDDRNDRWFPMSVIARFIESSRQKRVELPLMLEFLVKKGAALRFSKKKPHLHHLLHFVLTYQGDPDGTPPIQATVEYIIGTGYKDTLLWPPSLLEEIPHMATFEHLFRHANGLQLGPGSPLAHWIRMGGGIGLVQEMLAAGASPNAYSRRTFGERRTPLQAAAMHSTAETVELLLEEGADVDAAGRGHAGVTALQAACKRQLDFTEPNGEKLKIINLLIARGADVNAPPARRDGHTALQATAATGDLATAKLLLLHDPMADVNAPPCQGHFVVDYKTQLGRFVIPELGTALDIAAEHGRLDMVKLLLTCNALSHQRGENGYDGAICLAENKGHLAVADLIREHAKHDQGLDQHLKNPCLSQPLRHWSEYGYEVGPYEESVRSWETDSTDSDGTDYGSDSSTWTDSEKEDDADETESPGTVQDTRSVLDPDANQASLSEAVDDSGVQNSTQLLTHAVLPTAAAVNNDTWADEGYRACEPEGNYVATLHPMYAPNQIDFDTSMDLDWSSFSVTAQGVGIQHTGRFGYEPDVPERLIFEVDED